MRPNAIALAVLAAAALSACGGGGDDYTPTTPTARDTQPIPPHVESLQPTNDANGVRG